MTIRTFWMILIKILGLFLISGALIVLPQSISFMYYAFKSGEFIDIVSVSAINLILLLIYGLLIWLCVYKTSWIIEKLKLDKGFEAEKIELNIGESKIITIAIIVIGGLIFIETLPVLFRDLFIFFQDKNLFKDYPKSGWIIFGVCKVVIGYLLMTNSFKIAKFIDQKKK